MAVVFLLSALAAPGVPKPCLYPSAFTADVTVFNYGRNVQERGSIAYDGANERFYEALYSRPGANGRPGGLREMIVLYKEDAQFFIEDMGDGAPTCTYGPIEDSKKFTAFGVPKNASFHAEIIMGLTPTTFSCNEFGLETEGYRPNSTMTYHTHVTADECMPVLTHIYFGSEDEPRNLEESETRDYYNSVLGIEDPSVFIPPSGCTKRPPAPPGPSPGPSPPNPERDCYRGLETECAKVQHNATLCAKCAKAEGEKFKCTTEEDEEFCKHRPPAPHPPPPPRPPSPPGPNPGKECAAGLTKACASVQHNPSACASCVAKEGPIVHCTAAQDTQFCVPHPPKPPTPPAPAPPGYACWEALSKDCNATRAQGPKECAACTTKEGPAAHCAVAEQIEFCSSADRTCWQQLSNACGSDPKGPTCTACAKRVGLPLHCPTDEMERFCE